MTYDMLSVRNVPTARVPGIILILLLYVLTVEYFNNIGMYKAYTRTGTQVKLSPYSIFLIFPEILFSAPVYP